MNTKLREQKNRMKKIERLSEVRRMWILNWLVELGHKKQDRKKETVCKIKKKKGE